MNQQQIDDEIEELRGRYPMDAKSGTAQEVTKRLSALGALDTVVGEMQYQYDLVSQAYGELQRTLSK